MMDPVPVAAGGAISGGIGFDLESDVHLAEAMKTSPDADALCSRRRAGLEAEVIQAELLLSDVEVPRRVAPVAPGTAIILRPHPPFVAVGPQAAGGDATCGHLSAVPRVGPLNVELVGHDGVAVRVPVVPPTEPDLAAVAGVMPVVGPAVLVGRRRPVGRLIEVLGLLDGEGDVDLWAGPAAVGPNLPDTVIGAFAIGSAHGIILVEGEGILVPGVDSADDSDVGPGVELPPRLMTQHVTPALPQFAVEELDAHRGAEGLARSDTAGIIHAQNLDPIGSWHIWAWRRAALQSDLDPNRITEKHPLSIPHPPVALVVAGAGGRGHAHANVGCAAWRSGRYGDSTGRSHLVTAHEG